MSYAECHLKLSVAIEYAECRYTKRRGIGGLYYKSIQILMYGLCSKLLCMITPFKVTNNNKDTSLLHNLPIFRTLRMFYSARTNVFDIHNLLILVIG